MVKNQLNGEDGAFIEYLFTFKGRNRNQDALKSR